MCLPLDHLRSSAPSLSRGAAGLHKKCFQLRAGSFQGLETMTDAFPILGKNVPDESPVYVGDRQTTLDDHLLHGAADGLAIQVDDGGEVELQRGRGLLSAAA